MLKDALHYLSLGFSVIPLCRAVTPTTCDTPWGAHLKPHKVGKTPKIKWEEFQSRKATKEEVEGWLSKWPSMNLGVVTGAISGLAIADLDGPEGLSSAQNLGLSSSLVSLTGNGRQLWFAHPGVEVTGNVKLYPGLDLRGDGNYVVAPPSIHPNGKRYRWLGSPTLTKDVVISLPPFPTALCGAVAEQQSFESITTDKTRNNPDWVKTDLEAMTLGNIDDTLFRICSYFRNLGIGREVVHLLIQPHALRAGATPGHLDDKIENVWGRYEPKVREQTMRIGGESHLLSTPTALVLHTPTNPESLRQYLDSKLTTGESKAILSTGFKRLDEHFQNGLRSSRCLTVAARTGTGKTNFALSVSRSLTETGRRVLYFSTETPYGEIWDRFAALGQGVSSFEKQQLVVCDGFTPSISQVEEAIKEVKPDVFIFDHINHVAEDVKPLAEFMKGCNFLQRQYNTQGVIMAQLNRSADWVENGKRVTPRMSMIKGAGAIEQGSSRVLLLSEERVSEEGSEIVGVLDKNDAGTKGMLQFVLKKQPHWHFEEL